MLELHKDALFHWVKLLQLLKMTDCNYSSRLLLLHWHMKCIYFLVAPPIVNEKSRNICCSIQFIFYGLPTAVIAFSLVVFALI
jgi:hypothetical protein